MAPDKEVTSEPRSGEDFIDRQEELNKLQINMTKAVEGKGSMILLKGEAGVGKTKLAKVLEDICKRKGFHVLEGRCLYYESADPYLPFLEALGRTGIEDTVDTGMVGTLPIGLRALEESSISVTDKRELMFDDITSEIRNMSYDSPVLLFIDDLQWIDEVSSRLLHHLARHTKGDKVLILGAYRPEELMVDKEEVPLDRVIDRIKEEKLVEEIEVNRFSFQNSSKMIKNILRSDDLPQSFLMMVYKETEGNPYYIVEMLNSMVTEGVIDPYSYTWDPEKELSDIKIPASIKDIAVRRVETLSKEEKNLLMYAAIIGTEFDFAILETAMRMDVIEMLDIIDELIGHGLIHEKEGEDEVYRFGHIQIRAIIYDNMGKSRKRVLHQQIGKAIEELYGQETEDYYYALSRHFFMGKDYEKAYRYSMKAGERSMGSFAVESALDYYDTALTSLRNANFDDSRERERDLLRIIGDLSFDISDWGCSKGSFEKLLEIGKETDDKELQGEALRKLGHIYREIQKFEKAKETFEKCMEIVEEIEDHHKIADAHRGLGYLHWREGEFDDAIEHYEKALEMANKADSKRILSLTYLDMGNIYAHKGDNDTAIQYYKRSLPTLNEQNSFRDLAKAYNNIGDQYMKKEEWDVAIEYFEKCGDNAKKIGNKMFIGWSYFNRAEAMASKGDTTKAKVYAERAEKIMRNLNDLIGLSGVYRVMGITLKAEGDLKNALDYYNKALDTIKDLDIPFTYAETKYGMGDIYQAMGELEKARDHYEEAVRYLEKIGAEQFLSKVKKSLESLSAQG